MESSARNFPGGHFSEDGIVPVQVLGGEGFCVEGTPNGALFHWGREFPRRGGQVFLYYLKNDPKLNITSFSK